MSRKPKKRTRAANVAATAARLQALGRETHLDYVAKEAVSRVGRGPHLKGTIHEILFRDRQNTKLSSILRGERTELTTNPNNKTLDVLTRDRHGRVIARYQLKDTNSQGGISKVRQQAANGKYRYAKLLGTKETKKLYDKSGRGGTPPAKKMGSSGISSDTNTRVADNAGANSPCKKLLAANARDIGRQAGAAAAFAGVVSAGATAVSELRDVREGRITKAAYAGKVAAAGAKGGLSSGSRTAAALGLKETGKVVGKKIGCQALRRFAGSNAGTTVAFTLVEQFVDTAKLMRGKLDRKEYGRKSLQNAGSGGGALGGAAAGAALGSFVPVIGTTIGAVIGGIAGGLGGGGCGRLLGRFFFG